LLSPGLTGESRPDDPRRRHLDGLRAIIVLALVVLLPWPTHSEKAALRLTAPECAAGRDSITT
jgi:hypothetical protein